MANSGIPTLDAANLTYEFENVRVNQGATDNNVLQYVEKYSKKKLPPNLQYLDDFQVYFIRANLDSI